MKGKSNRILYLVLILALTAVVSGCGTSRAAKLNERIDDYCVALQRQDAGALVGFVNAAQREEFAKRALNIENFHISHAEVRSVNPDEKLNQAIVTIFVEYFLPDQASLISQKRLTSWGYDADRKSWMLKETDPFGREASSH